MKSKPILTSLLFLLLFAGLFNSGRGLAQIARSWSPLMVVPGYLDDTLPPQLIADRQKAVNAFASQPVAGVGSSQAVVYSRWTLLGGWTEPVDVLLSPSGDAQVLGAFLDDAGIMHVIYRGVDRSRASIYYSQAPIQSAGFAPAWTTPVIIGARASEPGSAALTGDGKGSLVVIYNGNLAGNGVYATASTDAGGSWTNPVPIFLTGASDIQAYYLQIDANQSGQAHAAWSDTNKTGNSSRAYYARFDFSSGQWKEPTVLAQDNYGDIGAGIFGPAYPSIIAEEETVAVMYNANGGTSTAGRPALWVRLSRDGGESWSEPYRPFPRHVGLSGGHDLVADGSGIIHALFVQRIEQSVDGQYSVIGGMWHSQLLDDQWTDPDRYFLGGDISGYDVSAVVSQGNMLLVTMREDPGLGGKGVLYAFAELNAPELPITEYATSTPAPAAITETPSAAPEETVLQQESESTGTTTAGVLLESNPAIPIIVGMLPVLLLITITLVIRSIRIQVKKKSLRY